VNVTEAITKIVREKYLGPFPTFSELHVVSMLLLLGQCGSVGRQSLSRQLGLGEGAVRTLIRRLKSARLVDVNRSGCGLTSQGQGLFQGLQTLIPQIIPIDGDVLASDRYSSAVLISKGATKVKKGLEQRDAAIRSGATSAVTLILSGGVFMMPGIGIDNYQHEYPGKIWKTLSETFHPKNGDVVIVSSGSSAAKARYGALAAAWSLIQTIPNS
jgi:hypothetical protein